ncbi:MAG: LAGLIDADG family homing endonuclease [Acidobacteriota bacterium]
MAKPVSFSENALRILKARYFMKNENGELIEKTPEQLFRRIAKYIAKAEKSEKLRKFWEKKFYEIMINKDFMPNSPTLTGAGRDMCLSACFVLPIEDSLASIFETVRNAALVHKEGGGTGFDFSRLRPKGSFVRKTQGIASGPISFLKVIDAATEAVKQGGCVAPETRISTEKGFVEIKNLGPEDKPGWYPLKIKVMTDEGERETDEFYNNGVAPVKTVITECGYHITATFNHRIRVIDENGNYVWKKMEELKEGDWAVLQKNSYFENDFNFPEFIEQPHCNSKKIKIPKKLNHNLSELFGYFIGDGCFHNGRLILSISHSQIDLKEHYENIMKEEFGIDGRIEQKQNDKSIKLIFQSNLLEKWFDLIGVKKENALKARIPEFIFKTTKENAASFLRGLFDADGTISKEGYVEISSVSEGLIDDVQMLLLSLGIPSKKRSQEDRNNSFGKNPIWRLRIITLEGYNKFRELIGFTSIIKKERLENINLKPWEFNDIIPNQHYLVASLYRYTGRGCSAGRTSRGADRNLYRDIQHYLPGISAQRNLTRSRLAYLIEKHTKLKESKLFLLFTKNQFYDKVKAIKEGKSLTLDLSVPGNHTYIANGFVSHNTRRGANMGILRVDHPDIEEFITMKRDGKTLTNFNISVAITDKFMEALKNNGEYEIVNPHTGKIVEKKSAKKIFDMIVESAWMIGDPGLVFIDRINQLNSTRELGEIRATNPCVTGETLISTEKGLEKMKELVERSTRESVYISTDNRVPIEVWTSNGLMKISQGIGISQRRITKAWKTGIKETFKLITESGYEVEATEDHKFLTPEGWIALKDIIPGHHKVLIQSGSGKFNENSKLPFKFDNIYLGDNGRIYRYNFPREWSKELGQVLGWLVGDGWLRDGWLRDGDKNCRVGFSFSKKDSEILNYLKPILNQMYGEEIKEVTRENGVTHLSYHSKYFVEYFKKLGVKSVKAEEKEVPKSIFTATEDAVIGFLQGLFSADGTIGLNEKIKDKYARLTSKSKKLLKGIQILLLNLGIRSKIYPRHRKERIGFNYITKKGTEKSYRLDGVLYELNIACESIERYLNKIGFLLNKQKNKIEKIKKYGFKIDKFEDQVKEIKYTGKQEVYDLTEPITLSFITNGLISLDCGEQPLHDYESCNLGSINLANFWDESKKEFQWERFEEVINTSVRFLDNVIDVNKYPLPQIEYMTKSNRRIGLGVMGFADLLIKMKIKYDTEEAIEVAEKIASFFLKKSLKASEKLAEERGNFPNIDKSIYKGKKMRNATTITIAPTGTISRIAGCSSSIEPIYAFEMVSKIIDSEIKDVHPLYEEWKKENPDKPLPDYFITAHEISPEWHIRMQAAYQRFANNAVSKTINHPNSAAKEDVEKAYMLAYDLGVKGVTIYRDGCRAEQVLYKEAPPEGKKLAPMERPDSLYSVTDKIKTGFGNLYITITYFMGKPFEVFASIGKSGYSTMADAEALGRLTSLCLRSGIEPKEIISQLKGIGGSEPIFHNGHLVQSIPDAIAQVLERHIGKVETQGRKDLNALKCPICGASLPDEKCPICINCGWTRCT